MTDREHTFRDTNRHVVEVPDTFAIARWRRDADVAAPLPHPATVALLVELRVLSAEAIGKALADNMSEQRFLNHPITLTAAGTGVWMPCIAVS
jgi:hypothetical protein